MPTAWSIAIALLVLVVMIAVLIGSVFFGRWFGGTRRRIDQAGDPHVGVVQGAILALLGLLLGFSFSGASSRFVERQNLLVREVGAIATAYQRCDLLFGGTGDALRDALREYTAARLELFRAAGRDADALRAGYTNVQAESDRLWTRTVAAARAQPEAATLIVSAVNQVGDLLSARNAAARAHTPGLVVFMMMACAIASCASVGYVLGLTTPPKPVRGPVILLTLLIAMVMLTIIDLDFSRHGIIQIDGRPLVELQEALRQPRSP
jgi:hypothetical protein